MLDYSAPVVKESIEITGERCDEAARVARAAAATSRRILTPHKRAPFLFGYSLLLPNATRTDSEPSRFCPAINSRAKDSPLVRTKARIAPGNKTPGKVGERNNSAITISAARNKSVSERTRWNFPA